MIKIKWNAKTLSMFHYINLFLSNTILCGNSHAYQCMTITFYVMMGTEKCIFNNIGNTSFE